jgi:23S rRNA (guanosine2251-2'-O)-methyltransferase
MNAQELRYSTESPPEIKRNNIYIVVDNVLDTYNTGAIFRVADAIAAKKVILCGGTETPPNIKIKRAAINTDSYTPWMYYEKTEDAIDHLKNKGVWIVGIEQSEDSLDYRFINTYPQSSYAFVVGNETHGISKGVLDRCDTILEIPLFGLNESLNVHIALAIVAYKVLENYQTIEDKDYIR